jgi:hypothetical protein
MTRTILALAIVVSVALQTPSPRRGETRQQRQEQSPRIQQPTSANQRGTEDAPLIVKEIPIAKTQEESAQEAKDRQKKASNDRNLVIATYILAGIAALQLFVFGYQAIQLKRTVKAAGEQVKDMKRAIAEASRSAAAMEEVSKHIEISLETAAQQSESMKESVKEAARLASAMEMVSKEMSLSSKAAMESVVALRERTAQQMRAYLCVIVGGGDYQDRAKNYKFASRPMLINAGHTPAHKVSYKAKAAILPVPLPEDFAFPLTEVSIGAALVGPQQNATLGGIVDDFCDDKEVEDVKIGKGKALYIWGIVDYEDVFGESHFTKFCQSTHFGPDGKVFGFFLPKHNEAN